MSDHWLKVAKGNDTGFIADIPLSHSFYREDKVFARDVADTIKGDLDRRNIPIRKVIEGKLRFEDPGPDR